MSERRRSHEADEDAGLPTEPVRTEAEVAQPEPPAEPGVPGEDLQHQRQPGESDSEFLARTRHTVVESQSPTDIVPNTPQISMGPRVPVEGAEGVSYATPPEGTATPHDPLNPSPENPVPVEEAIAAAEQQEAEEPGA